MVDSYIAVELEKHEVPIVSVEYSDGTLPKFLTVVWQCGDFVHTDCNRTPSRCPECGAPIACIEFDGA